MPSIEDAYRERIFAVAALNRIAEVIDAVRELPGRKTIVLVSEGFVMYSLGQDHSLVGDAMRSLVDRANRAAVVIYAVDPRGLVVTGLTAADNPRDLQSASMVASQRAAALRATQDGLAFVAGQTGGFAVINNNDIPGAMRRIMADQRGYYLIGYQPDASTFGPGSGRLFRKLKVKVTRPGLRIRTRTGFYGVPTE
jgi:VWFA-related protein